MAIERKAKVNPVDNLLAKVVTAVNKKYSVSVLDESSDFAEVKQFVSFGHYGLNQITGGGAPAGRLLEIYGAFSSGKSLLLTHLLAECQKAGGVAVLDDCEHAYNRHFGELIGIDNSRLLYTASESVEEVFDKMETTLEAIFKENPDQLVVYAWDSVAAVSCLAELDTDNVDTSGYNTEKAKAITKGTRKMVGAIGKHNVCLVVANQMKKAIGVIYGPQETTPGGDAIPFWASIRLKLGKGELIREGDKENGEVIGVRCKAQATKNKIVKPFQRCEIAILFDQGMLFTSGCVDSLIAKGVIVPVMTEEKVGKGGQIQAARNSGFYEFDGKKMRKKEIEDYFEEDVTRLDEFLKE
jgi:recombination protein RecA